MTSLRIAVAVTALALWSVGCSDRDSAADAAPGMTPIEAGEPADDMGDVPSSVGEILTGGGAEESVDGCYHLILERAGLEVPETRAERVALAEAELDEASELALSECVHLIGRSSRESR